MGSDLWSRRAGGVGGDCYTDDLVEVGSQHHPSGLRDGDVAVVVDVRQAHPVVVSYRNAPSSDERLGSSRGPFPPSCCRSSPPHFFLPNPGMPPRPGSLSPLALAGSGALTAGLFSTFGLATSLATLALYAAQSL